MNSSKPLLDHSLTYCDRALRNLPHRMRRRDIERVVRGLKLPQYPIYADFGCSNGFITARIAHLVGARHVYGLDHLPEHFEIGRTRHPQIDFRQVSLNDPEADVPQCDLITCFETLEHVGDLRSAVIVLSRSLYLDGAGLISVPIEIGWRGIVKFAIKFLIYGYRLSELPQQHGLLRAYLWALLRGKRMGRFRSQRRPGWGTHFGFDYRDVDDALREVGLLFYVVRMSAALGQLRR